MACLISGFQPVKCIRQRFIDERGLIRRVVLERVKSDFFKRVVLQYKKQIHVDRFETNRLGDKKLFWVELSVERMPEKSWIRRKPLFTSSASRLQRQMATT